ncbi:unnamed protein product [Danaus chrysippus]|uniref:(African queen) hypothetical protein n=1 Tax=Danaus chrysippus TaxID=151541 RepID=A0A8J2VZB0_9NEOP|nr:unnamed protein product [Danaus chrysippus]
MELHQSARLPGSSFNLPEVLYTHSEDIHSSRVYYIVVFEVITGLCGTLPVTSHGPTSMRGSEVGGRRSPTASPLSLLLLVHYHTVPVRLDEEGRATDEAGDGNTRHWCLRGVTMTPVSQRGTHSLYLQVYRR